ncbi:MAG: ATP-binding protein [Candidatus Doudnabacteria bacterium]
MILILIFFVILGAEIYFLLLPPSNQSLPQTALSQTVKFPLTGSIQVPQAAAVSAKSLYATPLDGLTTSSLLIAVGIIGAASFQNISTRKRVEKDLENAKIAARNVYEDLQAEAEKLAQAKAKEEAILLSVGDGLIALDEKGKIIFMNHTAEQMLGYNSSESIGKQWYEILIREDEKGNPLSAEEGAIHAALTTAATTTTTITTSFYYIRKDGTKFPVSRTVSPIVLGGKVIGAINIFRDITREKEIDRAKTEFVSLASHQLRTPLTGIRWLIELIMKKEKLTDKGKEYLNDILYSVQRSNALVKLLLDTSRIENGSVGVHAESLELVGFIEKHIGEYRLLSEKKKLSLKFTPHPEEITIVTDMNLLEYILQNLVTNAIDYTPPAGKIDILLEKKENSVILQVKDSGIGIPKKDQEHLFEKFMRASNAVVTKTDGTGLGLYIAREAAKLLGGKIWVESPTLPEEKGTTFFVELPLISPSKAGGSGLAYVKNLK